MNQFIRLVQNIWSNFFKYKNKHKTFNAFTLIEALVAMAILAIAGMVFMSANASFLKNGKIAELKETMQSFNVDGIGNMEQYSARNFETLFALNGITYAKLEKNTDPKAILNYNLVYSNSGCSFDETNGYLSGCEQLTTGATGSSSARIDLFQRAVKISKGTNELRITVIVACVKGKCDSKTLPPIKYTIVFYD